MSKRVISKRHFEFANTMYIRWSGGSFCFCVDHNEHVCSKCWSNGNSYSVLISTLPNSPLPIFVYIVVFSISGIYRLTANRLRHELPKKWQTADWNSGNTKISARSYIQVIIHIYESNGSFQIRAIGSTISTITVFFLIEFNHYSSFYRDEGNKWSLIVRLVDDVVYSSPDISVSLNECPCAYSYTYVLLLLFFVWIYFRRLKAHMSVNIWERVKYWYTEARFKVYTVWYS